MYLKIKMLCVGRAIFISIYSILLGLRTVCVDWLNNEEPRDDPAMRGEKDPKTGYRVDLPHRKVGVSSTQVSHSNIQVVL